VSDLEDDGKRVTFLVSGDLNPTLQALADHPVTDLEIAHPTLEEVFLTYYQGDGQ
jgi:ABC-2 type transport system ATP-binding protein